MPVNPRLHELLDACRPGCDDLLDAEMAELAAALQHDAELRHTYDRVQRQDAAIAEAMQAQDVPIPPGLSERLLARIEDTKRVGLPPAAPRVSRRRIAFAGVAGGVLAATVLIAGLVWFTRPTSPVTQQQLAEQSAQWLRDALAQQEQWVREGVAEQPDRPLDTAALRGVKPRAAWRLTTAFDRRSQMYEITPGRDRRALLFVVRSHRRFEVGSDPVTTLPSTGGWSLGAWQRGDRLYVLAVEGGVDRLQGLLRIPQAA